VRTRLRAPADGTEVTTSGSWRLLSARSIAALQALRVPHLTIGIEMTRLASLPHTGQLTVSGAVPRGRVTSKTPSC